MKATDDLHKLINTMDKAEKRFFKLFASRYESNGKSNYLRLFDYIERQQQYDELALKEYFNKETFLKHLPSEKNYLYNLILDSLLQFHSEAAEVQKLQKKVQQANILFNKGMISQSLKILKKAKEQTRELESHQTLLEIIHLQKMIIAGNYYSNTTEEELEAIYKEERDCIDNMQQANEYWLLFSRFYRFHFQKGSARDEIEWGKIEEIIRHPLLEDISSARTFRTKLDYMHIHALYHFMKGDYTQAFDYNLSYLQLLESRPAMISSFARRYMASLNNYLLDSLGLERYKEVGEGIEKLKTLPQKYAFYNTEAYKTDIFRLSTILELNLYIKTGNFNEGYGQVAIINEGLEKYGGKIVKHNLFTIYYMVAYLSFGAGKLTESIRWLNRIINDTEDNILQDIHSFARIFSLIVHYELQNDDILEYLFVGTYRYLARRNKVYRAESILLKYLKRFLNIADQKAMKQAFGQLYNELLPLLNDPVEKGAFEYFDLISWLEAKMSDKSFAEIVKSKAAEVN